MVSKIPEFVILQALLRSGGRCECTSPDHSHSSRCFASIKKNNHYRGFEGLGGWEILIEDNSDLSLNNIKVVCMNCYKKLSPTDVDL